MSKKLIESVYLDLGKKYRWVLKARNGRKVASSGESFASKGNAIKSLKTFVKNIRLGKYICVEQD